jgi:hypothetical protein
MLKYIRLSPVFFLALLGLIVSLLIACSQTGEDGSKNSDLTKRATEEGPSGYGYDDGYYGGYGYDPYGGYGYGYDYRYDY